MASPGYLLLFLFRFVGLLMALPNENRVSKGGFCNIEFDQ